MKPGTRINRWLLVLVYLFAGLSLAHGQQIDPSYQVNWPTITGSGAPVFPCTTTNYGEPYTDTTNNVQYHCGSAGWFSNSGGGNTTSSMTSGYVPKATGANSIGNSSLQDNGVTVSTPEPVVGASFSAAPGTTNAVLDLPSVGTLPGQPAANTVRVTSPNSTTSYVLVYPGTYPTSGNPFMSCSNANPSICTWASNSVNWSSPGAIGATTPNAGTFTTLSAQHLVGTTGAPTYIADAGAGSGPTISILSGSTDISGWAQVTPGSSPASSAGIVTVKFNTTFAAVPKCWIAPANTAAAALSGSDQAFVPQSQITTSQFVISAGGTALPAGTYIWLWGCF